MPQGAGPLPRDLPSLTALRAAAALVVFACHLSQWGVLPMPGAALGETGVAFFFVLSGFLLTWGYVGRVETRRFYVRRFARIWPSHAVMWGVALLVPRTVLAVEPGPAVANLVLVQAWVPRDEFVYGVNGVAWSLSCEFAFYALFPAALLVLTRVGVRTAWAVAIGAFVVVSVFTVAASRPGIPYHLVLIGFTNPLVRLPEFLLGIAAALAVRSGWRPTWWWVGVITAFCVGGLAVTRASPADDVWTTPAYLLVIVAAAAWDVSDRRSWLSGRALVYAGKVSFAFYLVHELVIINLQQVLGTGAEVAAAALVVAVAGAVALHHLVELPAQSLIVRSLDSGKRTTPSDAVDH
jgi:peptidoglycan/LPS O-acetylase OafA/YrhL